MKMGIDLGTTHSLVAVYENEQARLIKNSLGKTLTPSVISIDENDSILIGEPAKARLVTHPKTTVANFKRYMGSEKKITLGKKTFCPEELSALILMRLKEDVISHYASQEQAIECDDVVITVPAYFNAMQRKATVAAAEISGFKQINLINEPTAAALAYGIREQNTDKTYLVADLGGGTFDVSILEMFSGIMEIRASAGDNFLGGNDFTRLLVEAFFREAAEPAGCKRENLSLQDYAILQHKIELLKHRLSNEDQVLFTFPVNNKIIKWQITRATFTKVCSELLEKIRIPLERVMRDAKLRSNEIEQLFLVGGATRMPLFRSFLGKLFGVFPQIYLNPDEVVAMGAAIQAALIADDKSMQEIVVTDVCPYTLGVAVAERDLQNRYIGETFLPIIERNTVIPTSRAELIRPTADYQRLLGIRVYQGESHDLADNVLLGKFDLHLTPKKLGEEQFELRFSYDVSGLLEVEIKSLTSNKTENFLIKNYTQAMSKEDIAASLSRLEKFKIHPRDQTENQFILANLGKLHEELLGEQRAYIQHLITEFKSVLATQNDKTIRSMQMKLKEVIDEIERDLAIVSN